MASHLSAVTDRASLTIPYNPKSLEESFNGEKETQEQWKGRIVEAVASRVETFYIDGALGAKMARVVREKLKEGQYTAMASPLAFKDALYNDLDSVFENPDNHLGLNFSESPASISDPWRHLENVQLDKLDSDQRKYYRKLFEEHCPDFSKEVEAHIIPGTQIGYLKINQFHEMDETEFPETRAVIDTAMKVIVNADSLIIDLRENHGGSPDTCAFVESYLFDKADERMVEGKVLVNQIYQRSCNKTISYYAEPRKLDQIFGGQKPLYVLTSEETFSAGEELAYDLQSIKRAQIIGQTTGGGAHPMRPFVLDDHLSINIPYQKAVNPYTGTNWEGKGVTPDHPLAKEEDALSYARALIESAL